MFKSLTTLSSFTKVAKQLPNQTMFIPSQSPLLTLTQQRNFSNFFKRPEDEKPSDKKKASLLEKAKTAFFEGFFVGSDFNKMEKFLVLNEAKSQEESAERLMALGEHTQALRKYETALQLTRKSFEDNDREVAHYTRIIGDINFGLKEWDQAVNSYQECLEALRESPLHQNQDIGRCLVRLATCLINENRYGEATNYFRDALDMYMSLDKKVSCTNEIASCQEKLVECYMKLDKYDQALKYLDQVMKPLRKDGIENSQVIEHYLDYGLALAYTTQNYTEAYNYVNKYMQEQSDKKGDRSLTVGISYLRIGEINLIQNKPAEALKNLQKALAIIQEQPVDDHKWTGICHKAIGQAHKMQGDYKACLESSRKALMLLEDGDSELDKCYINIALCYEKAGRHDLALENFQRGYEVREKISEGFAEGDALLMAVNAYLTIAYRKDKGFPEMVTHYEMFIDELCKFIESGVQRERGAY